MSATHGLRAVRLQNTIGKTAKRVMRGAGGFYRIRATCASIRVGVPAAPLGRADRVRNASRRRYLQMRHGAELLEVLTANANKAKRLAARLARPQMPITCA